MAHKSSSYATKHKSAVNHKPESATISQPNNKGNIIISAKTYNCFIVCILQFVYFVKLVS